MNPPFCVLTIAGSDSGGGAGVQADQRTVRALGGHALTALTAVTAQDTRRVVAWRPVSASLIRAQVETCLAGFPVAAVKTGLLPGAAAIRAVASCLARRPGMPLVVDPVLASSGGTRFLSKEGVRVLRRRLLPLSALATPNWPEAAELSGLRVGSHRDAERAAVAVASACGCPVLVKGGHGPAGPCRDCLALPDGGVVWFEHPRIRTPNTHGTGCVLSTAIAAWLGRGASLPDAVRFGQSFLRRALARGRGLDWSAGRGPAFFGSR
jgi:hydroxymethylpyrimidine/phosphomethylpyrimidine kinase